MANQQISDFTALSTASANDLLVVVDVSDTTDSPQGTTKKITLADLASAVLAIESGASEFLITEG